MSRIRGRNTGPEMTIFRALLRKGVTFNRHSKELPGRPDMVFSREMIAVFVDGDYWHGFRFPLWKSTLPRFWQQKISENRSRDKRNFRKLRRMGWCVLRVWEHQIKRDLEGVVRKILAVRSSRRSRDPNRTTTRGRNCA